MPFNVLCWSSGTLCRVRSRKGEYFSLCFKSRVRNHFLNNLYVGFSLSRNCMKRLAQRVLVNARHFYFLPKARSFANSSVLGNLFSFYFELVWRHDNENVQGVTNVAWVRFPNLPSCICWFSYWSAFPRFFSPGSLAFFSLYEKNYP